MLFDITENFFRALHVFVLLGREKKIEEITWVFAFIM